jgi:hypothetical protein
MVSLAFLTIVTATMLPVAMAAYAKDGKEWRFFDDYLNWSRETLRKDPAKAKSKRALGTFWNAEKAAMFPTTSLAIDEWCCVVLYYPTMVQRGRDSLDGRPRDTTWGVPFAIALFCPGTVPTNNKDFPDFNTDADGEHAMVFHQLNVEPGYKNDIYVILS